MDQLPRGNEGFANNNMFANSQQYNASYDNLFQNGADHQTSYDAGWGVNASNYPVQSRAQHQPAPAWPQNANHLSAPPAHAGINGQASPYARPISHSPASYGQNTFSGYGALQNSQYRQSQFDPSLVPPHALNQNFNNYSTTNYETPNAGTIAPRALQHEPPPASNFAQNRYEGSPYQANNFAQPRQTKPFTPEIVDQAKLLAAIPVGKNGGRFSIINFDDLAKATKSERMGNFVNIGIEAHNWDVNRAALPNYVPRKSRSELRKLAGSDPKLLAKLGKKTLKKERALAAAPKPLQSATKVMSPSTEKVKYEQESSSDESSSDDDESSYTSEDEGESPLPAKRPDRPKEGTEYDTIKALWRGKRKNLDPASIRNGLGEFWEIAKTIRDRWKADVAAVQDAESKNRTNELPLLESRVKDQRDMLETAFKAALKHGHRGILELMSENVPLLYLCYQFLLDRVKAEDYNSPLPRVMLETMSLFTTLTNDKLEKTHLDKMLPRFIKKGDAKTQYYAKRIAGNAATASDEKSADASTKKTGPKEAAAGSPTGKRAEPEPVAGIKRPASTAAEGGVSKKLALSASKANGASTAAKPSSNLKKPTPTSDSTKGAATTAAAAVKPKQVVAKPSGLFSSLQSAAKKPGTSTLNKGAQSTMPIGGSKPVEKASTGNAATNQNAAPVSTFSFAETMANLSKPKEEKPVVKQEKQIPNETPEEKAKRLRKESRRHLHVRFKPKEELVQIHEFHHDPEEELGHDANQVRDLADVGGEGRMFKQQHQMMDIDEDDETVEEDEKLVEFSTPTAIDFSVIEPEQRNQNYVPFGGGKAEPESEERAIRERYEADTLLVFYADANDIPPNPREPSDPYNGPGVDALKKIGMPEEKYAMRARQRKFGSPQQHKPVQPRTQSTPALGFDLSKLANFGNQAQAPQPTSYQAPAQPAAPTNDAISNILASLQQVQANQSTPPQPAISAYNPTYSAPTPNLNAFPTQQPPSQPPPAGQPDLAAILAQIQQNQPSADSMTGGYNYNAPAPSSMPNMTPSYQQPPQTQQSAPYENPERKQWREGGNNNADPSLKLRRQNPAQNPYYRTKVCKYWQEGRCQKGEGCSYKHAEG